MSDVPPDVVEAITPSLQTPLRIFGIGKCAVVELGDGWICATSMESIVGPKYVRAGETHKSEVSGSDEPLVEATFHEPSPLNSVFPSQDETQSRIYYHRGSEDSEGDALVVTPSYEPFRASSMGRKRGDFRNFDEDGYPVPEILLLYALKTGCKQDRLNALFALPLLRWEDALGRSFQNKAPSGNIVSQARQLAGDSKIFEKFVMRMLPKSDNDSESMERWSAWDEIANKAFKKKRKRDEKYAGAATPGSNENLIIAVRVEAIEHGGLPSQAHVRKRWEALNASNDMREFGAVRGSNPARLSVSQKTKGKADKNRDWRGARDRLGFAWLPTQAEWEGDWLNRVESLIR